MNCRLDDLQGLSSEESLVIESRWSQRGQRRASHRKLVIRKRLAGKRFFESKDSLYQLVQPVLPMATVMALENRVHELRLDDCANIPRFSPLPGTNYSLLRMYTA